MFAKLRWKLRWYWGYYTGNRDGVDRLKKLRFSKPPPSPAIKLYYNGEPGDPGSDTPIAYELVSHD